MITDAVVTSPEEKASAAGSSDDFFSSWDKPTIKRPSNPPSRTQTPSIAGRTGSPFLNPSANGTGTPRSKSPLNSSEGEPAKVAPSTVVRKAGNTAGLRKTNALGGAKKSKFGAQKVGAGADIDFDAAEKKAKEEAERKAKLGYDPDAEEEAAASNSTRSGSMIPDNKIASPTPVNPAKSGYGAQKGHERSKSEMERLGMGVGRLGFGQVGGSKPAASAPKKMGFGATGASRGAQAGIFPWIMRGFLSQLTHLVQMTMRNMLARSSELRKESPLTNSSAAIITIRIPKLKLNSVCKDLKAQLLSRPMHTLEGQRTITLRMSMAITAIWRAQPGTSSANLASQQEMILRT